MTPGGTLNTRVLQNDLNEIQSNQATGPTLLRLPLIASFRQGTTATAVNTWAYPYGGRPDLRTDTGKNPILGNMAAGVEIVPTRIQLQQPANCLQLIWQALDEKGNYVCSYPLNSSANAIVSGANTIGGFRLTADTSVSAEQQYWAYGWLRLNGLGPWFPMSLIPASATVNGLIAFPFSGFSSIAAPMSFLDWIGYWDGAGDTSTGPGGANAFLLAIAGANLSLSSNGGTLGLFSNYATPSGSGPEQSLTRTDTQRSQDILVRGGSNGQ